MIQIMNLREVSPKEPYDVSVDRRTALGNPYGMKSELFRKKVCYDYEQWFKYQVLTAKHKDAFDMLIRLRRLYQKYGKLRLFCWCAPKQCHAETIKAWLENNP